MSFLTPKTDNEKSKKPALARMKNSTASRYTTRNHAEKNNDLHFRRFWVKQLRHSKTACDKKRYTFITVARFGYYTYAKPAAARSCSETSFLRGGEPGYEMATWR